MQSNDYKKSASAFIHGFRYNARTLSRLLEVRLRKREYPVQVVQLSQTCCSLRFTRGLDALHRCGICTEVSVMLMYSTLTPCNSRR